MKRATVATSIFLVLLGAALALAIASGSRSDARWAVSFRVPVKAMDSWKGTDSCGHGGRKHLGFPLGDLRLSDTPVQGEEEAWSAATWCTRAGAVIAVYAVEARIDRSSALPRSLVFQAPASGPGMGATVKLVGAPTPVGPGDANGDPLWQGHARRLRYTWLIKRPGCPGCRIVWTLDLTPTAATVTARRAS